MIRTNDTICSKDGKVFRVKTIGNEKVNATEVAQPHRKRTFKKSDLELIDLDEGIWQEMEGRHDTK